MFSQIGQKVDEDKAMRNRSRMVLVVFILLAVLTTSACVERDEFRALQGEVRRTTVEQNQQIRSLNEQVTDLQQRVDALDVGRGTQLADHLNDFAQLQQEVATIRGQVEELSHREQTQVQAELETLKKKVEQQEEAPQSAAVAPEPQPTPSPEPQAAERLEDIYKEARFAFEEGDYAKARETFTALIERYPDSSFADSAQFWVGECYFKEGNFKKAILEYEKLISQYPQSEKVPSAFLKQGMAFEKLGDTESARYLYSRITKDYPDSDQAPMAAHRLKSLP